MATSYKQTLSPIDTSSSSGFVQSITALAFDPVSDILWTGQESGVVVAFLGTRGIRGPSFCVGGNSGVKKITPGENHIRALGNSNEGMGSWTKGGVNKWFFRPPTENVVTFSNTPSSSSFLAASLDSLELAFITSGTGVVSRKVSTTSLLTHLNLSHSMLVSGSLDGYVRIHDPRTGLGRGDGAENFVKAHSRSIEGLEVVGNFIFTTGMAERHARPFPDPLVKVYDVRTMRPLPPIPFSAGPSFIHALPNRTSSLAVISTQGSVNIVDASNPSTPIEFYQLDIPSYDNITPTITATSMSPTATYIAFGDSDGRIYLMSQADGEIPFNGYEGQPVPWADTPAPLPDIEWTKSTPLNSIGMPYFDTQLLSVWPSHLSPKAASYSPPPRIPPQIVASMKFNENIAYASLPKELRGRRNVTNALPRREIGRFRSGKTSLSEAEPDDGTFDHDSDEVPRSYRRVEIEYSKFGIEDFDFGFYNRTQFSGLETHILHSYTNSIIQLMHYIRPIRQVAQGHTTIDCPRENCLLCELGFISRMLEDVHISRKLEDAHGINCQASNFCKTVGFLAQASNAMELMDYGRDSAELDYAQKIQRFHRFLIDHLNTEAMTFPPNHDPQSQMQALSPITQILGITGRNVVICSNCKHIREKHHSSHVIDLIYTKKSSEQNLKPRFIEILRNSLFREITHKATCQACKQFSIFTSRRSMFSSQLPPVLAINTAVNNDEHLAFWQDLRASTFLEPQFSIQDLIGEVDCTDDSTYNLRAMVVKITEKDRKAHLVAIVRVPEAEERGLSSPWFLFNDFVVTNISQDEALSFQGKWKVPAILYFERSDMKTAVDFKHLTQKINPMILSQDKSISVNRDKSLIKHEFLTLDEMPKPGTLVSIDAEFVLMQQEETEFKSDGTKKVLRPARLSLARVSVLRGNGPRSGIPFVDDHIHTNETIVDYLTEFSGIKYGDLDPQLSIYTLTPLKLVYKKLRFLVDCGCIFIGHGLSKDFRIINIYVPPEQVIDTVDLYFIRSRSRRLSLRFLSWYVLGEHIQTETHDSIEDARSALRLYNAYQELTESKLFDQKLEEIYREGRQYGFKPPALTDTQPDLEEKAPPSDLEKLP